ncbi:MAG: hypothetical protein JWQ96_2265 [Segetibacter sp.]|nr:hypothetical protein [Segetibacter sp.]
MLTFFGTIASIILLAILNSIFDFNLSGGDIFFWGLISGVIIGYVGRRFLTFYILKRAEKFMQTKMPANNKRAVITEDIPYTDV